MKKILFAMCLSMTSVAWSAEPVVSGYGLDTYHGYVGLGYNHPYINLSGYKAVESDGIVAIFGHNYKPWLDLEFRASTSSGYKKASSDISGASSVSIKQNYNLVGLLKFKWQPVKLIEFNVTTGMNYMALEKVTATSTINQYKSGLVLGGGVGFHLVKNYSINLDYQSYQRNNFLGSEKDTWATANLSVQYHF